MISEELLAGYVTGELSEPERVDVETALAASPRLRDELSRYERLFLLLAAAAAEDLEAPADLQTRIVRQVAVKAYLNMAFDLASSLFGAYGRAIVYYLKLG